jgi:hypothetical protein
MKTIGNLKTPARTPAPFLPRDNPQARSQVCTTSDGPEGGDCNTEVTLWLDEQDRFLLQRAPFDQGKASSFKRLSPRQALKHVLDYYTNDPFARRLLAGALK